MRIPERAVAQRSPAQAAGRCHCGRPLVPCRGCRAPRCLGCDPYRSDDCTFGV